MSFRSLKAAIAAFAMLVSLGNANALNVSGNFNATGYDAFTFTVGSPSTVEFTYTGGYNDPTFSLFNSSGAHMVSNDDSIGLYSHLTQNLAAGTYSFLVSYCCTGAYNYTTSTGAAFNSTDGFNSGSYWFGGSGTLAGMEAYLQQNNYNYANFAPYALTISNNVTLGTVPEPAALALFGLGLAGLAFSRRK